MTETPAPEQISADELAYHRYIEARHVAALQVIAARSEWHAYLVEKFGLKSGVDQIAPDGAILRRDDKET